MVASEGSNHGNFMGDRPPLPCCALPATQRRHSTYYTRAERRGSWGMAKIGQRPLPRPHAKSRKIIPAAREPKFCGGSQRKFQPVPMGARYKQRTRAWCVCMGDFMFIPRIRGVVVGRGMGKRCDRCDRQRPQIACIVVDFGTCIAEHVPGLCAGEGVSA